VRCSQGIHHTIREAPIGSIEDCTRERDSRSDYLVRVYLSFFSLAKLIRLAKPIYRSTFQSITDQPVSIDNLKVVLGEEN